jgi:hypothetical protein
VVVRKGTLLACILFGNLTGCAKPTSGLYQGAFDGQATEWEVPPSRAVTGADGGTGAGGGGLPGGSAGNLPVCTKQDQGNCCYEDKPGRPFGNPQCTWQRLLPGESTVIMTAFKKDVKVTLPVVVTLTSVSPATFATYDDCVKAPLGFVLTAPGMKEDRLVGNVSHYDLKSDGTWVGRGGGGQSDLVAARDTEASGRDGGAPMPSYTLHDGLCKPLQGPEFTASIQVFDQIDFTIDGVEYSANFRSNPNGGVTSYYVVIDKGF